MKKIPTFTLPIFVFAIFGYFAFQWISTSNNSGDGAASRPDLKSQERSGLAEDNPVNQNLGLKVEPLILNDQTIEFPHTDDNENESIIIKSDKDRYTSFAGSDVYFSVTNTSDIEEDGILLFHFDQNFKRSKDDPSGVTNPRIQFLEQRLDNNWSKHNLIYNNISINATKLAQALEKKKDIPETFDVSAGTQFKLAANETIYFKAKISYPPGSEGEFWIETLGENGGYGLLDPWYASTYSHRKKITIDNAMVSGGSDLSNFPVLININNDASLVATSLGGKVASGAGEFVFTSSDGTTKLDHEIEYYSDTLGHLIAWVEVPTLATATDTILYLYFGGPTSGATNQNKTGTWNTDYKAVWHLGNGDSTASNFYTDSTSNIAHGTLTDVDGDSTDITGKIVKAVKFNGDADYITTADVPFDFERTNSFSGSAWIKTPSFSGTERSIFGKGEDTPFRGWAFYAEPATIKGFLISTWTSNVLEKDSAAAVDDDLWHHVAFTYLGADPSLASNMNLYVDGALSNGTVAKDTLTATILNNVSLKIGADCITVCNIFEGVIDEARVSGAVLTAGWITTEYNNQNSPGTYVTAERAEKEIRTAPSVKIR